MVDLASIFAATRFVGIDVDPVSVKLAQQVIANRADLHGRVEARVSDGSSLPSDLAGQFDVVTMLLVLHEVEPASKMVVLRECHRALRPGGTLVLFDERYPDGPSELRDSAQIFAVMAQWYEAMWGNVLRPGGDPRDARRGRVRSRARARPLSVLYRRGEAAGRVAGPREATPSRRASSCPPRYHARRLRFDRTEGGGRG